MHACPSAGLTLDPLGRAISNTEANTMAALPTPPDQLPSFEIFTGGEVPRNVDGFPCETHDFQVDRRNWVNDIPIANRRTIAGILGHRVAKWEENCFHCEQGADGCPRGVCVRVFHRERMRPDYRAKFQSE